MDNDKTGIGGSYVYDAELDALQANNEDRVQESHQAETEEAPQIVGENEPSVTKRKAK